MTKKPYSKPQVRAFALPVASGGIIPMGSCGGGETADVCGAGGGAQEWGCSRGSGDSYGCNVGRTPAGVNNCFAGSSALNP
jgi:hypothetical protein